MLFVRGLPEAKVWTGNDRDGSVGVVGRTACSAAGLGTGADGGCAGLIMTVEAD